jgi:hypothetical protein
MAKNWVSLCGLQIVACALGLVAGFVPGISFTGRFWGLGLVQGGFGFERTQDAPLRVTQVEAGSPAYRAGFQTGDEIQTPRTIDAMREAQNRINQGNREAFLVRRGKDLVAIDTDGAPPELAAVWYADLWYPIAGTLFLCIGVLVFATAPLAPPPLWRSVPLTVAGLGFAIGFGVAIGGGSLFSRWRIYQRWPMGTGNEWYFQQGLIGILAGILLAVLAAAQIRKRLEVRLSKVADAQ